MADRKYSDDKDLKGPQHPLCMNCNHREDMHHDWNSKQVIETDAKGNQRIRIEREKVFDAKKPCQHACKCAEYK